MSEENNIVNIAEKLSEKVKKEYAEFIDEVKANADEYTFTTGCQAIDYAISHAYEIAVKSEISQTIYSDTVDSLTEDQAIVLSKCVNTLDEIYQEWIKTDGKDMADLINCAARVADDIISSPFCDAFLSDSQGRK